MRFLCTLGTVLVSASLASQTQSANSEQPVEMVISGQRTLRALRFEIEEAEDRFLEIYNDLNDNDLYDIQCRMETRPNTRIKYRTCIPKYYYDARAEEARAMLTGIPAPAAIQVAGYHGPLMEENMKAIVIENRELLESIEEYVLLKEEYEEFREDYFSKD